MFLISGFVLFIVLLIPCCESQFAYPIDPNPPQVDVTSTCFVCDGDDCDVEQDSNTNDVTSCTGPRVSCWTIQNMETLTYTRTCERPPSIRQGVFCNRHMEGREFCYSYDSPGGRQRLCGKCCLTDLCNGGRLTGIPDEGFKSCVACQGDNEEICNSELSLDVLENSTYTEQCLLPNSDCWTEKRQQNGRSIYFRGCQLRTCNNDFSKKCSFVNGQETCESCCEGRYCNRFNGGSSLATPYSFMLVLLLATSWLCLV